ncbi:MAG: type 1 glutamine amidotransferase [Nocardioides sp.]
MSTPRLLVVEHEAMCPPGWVGEWLVESGADLDVRRPYRGDDLPTDLEDHAGLLVLGGSMGANDDADHAWLTDVKLLVRGAAEAGAPVLGICLGHQLAAVALGGRVERTPGGQQIGVLDVGWTAEAAGDELFAPLARPVRAVQWNNDIVTAAPAGTVVLAQTPRGEIQAARFAPTVWGVQWHPEAGETIVRGWAEHDRDDAVERGIDLDGYVAGVAAAEDELQATWVELARRFVGLTTTSSARA